MVFTKEAMRTRLAELNKLHDEIRAKSTPMRAKRDAWVKENEPKRQRMDKEIVEAEKGLYEIEMERSVLARALGGKSLKAE